MTFPRLVGCVLAACALSQTASAAIIRFTDFGLWSWYAGATSNVVISENFNGIANGSYSSPFSGSAGGINWTAVAAGGLRVQNGLFSTTNPETMTFAVSPGVRGIGGNFFATDGSFSAVPAIVQVTLNDGSAYIGFTSSPTEFIGFFSTDAEITSVAVASTAATGATSVYPTADNLYFAAVPAPGAMGLLAVAGIFGSRRRR